VFVHISAVEQAGLAGLAEGQPLGFTLVDRGGRISATDLKIEGEPMPVPAAAAVPVAAVRSAAAAPAVRSGS
jgi:CspA family cold shock protein